MVNYDAIIEREYFDPITKQMIKVNLKVIDALYLDFLRKIEDSIRKHG